MSTLRQIEANRRNAQKSTGPTSVTGKAVSSMNSLKTGLHAKSLVLPYESRADFEQLVDEYYRHHHPTSPEARSLVDDLIRCEWTLRRLDQSETQMYLYQNDSIYSSRDPEKNPLGRSVTANAASFSKLQYRVDCTRRANLRALQALKQLQAEAAAAPPEPELPPPTLVSPSLTASPQTTSPKIGFVPPLPVPAPPQPAIEPLSPGPTPPVPEVTSYTRIR